jgi:hypothetical protein
VKAIVLRLINLRERVIFLAGLRRIIGMRLRFVGIDLSNQIAQNPNDYSSCFSSDSTLLMSTPRRRRDAGLRLSLPAGPSFHHAWPRFRPLAASALNASRECSRADPVRAMSVVRMPRGGKRWDIYSESSLR